MTALIYMMAALVLPDVPADRPIDLKDHYYRERTVFFGFSLAAVVWSVLREILLNGEMLSPGNLAFHLAFGTMATIAILTGREWVHKTFAEAMVGIFIVYVGALFMKLG